VPLRVALFHSTLGLRAVERELADALVRDGHDVLLPDLFDGRVAGTIEEGLALKDAVGWEAIRDRARAALGHAPADTVLAGVLLHGYAGIPADVRPGVRAALHVAVGDRFAPEETVAAWHREAAARGVEAEVYRYADAGHFFTDRASEDYDEAAARALRSRVRAFLR
jgi:dienelactone hydrolase